MKGILFISTFMMVIVALAQPVNDNPCNAIPLDINPGCISFNGDNIGATSSNVVDPSCGGYNGEDVWFVLLVPANGSVSITMGSGSLSNMNMSVYSASDCNSTFTEVDCNGGGGMPSSNITGLVPGSYLFIRVFDYYSPGIFGLGADPLEQGTFSICAQTSGGQISTGGSGGSGSYGCGNTPPAGNTCETATPICTFDGYCGSTAGYTANYWSSGNNGLGGVTNADGIFCGSIENNSFISFIAGASTVELNVEVSGGFSCSDGVQFMMFGLPSAGVVCQNNSIQEYGCESPMAPGNNNFTGNGLIPGQEYYLMVDGFAGDVCDYEISAISGVLVEMSAGPDQTICLGESIGLTIYGAGNGTINWSGPYLNSNTGETVIATPTSVGTYEYIVEAPTVSPACTGQATDQDTVLVTVVDVTPISVLSGTCVGGETVLTATGGSNYTWGPPSDLTQSTGSPVTANPVLTTVYTVTGSDINGCPLQTTIEVEPCDVPCDTPSVVYPTLICVGNSGVPLVDFTGGTFSFTIAPGDGALINPATGEISNVTDGTVYNITYTYTNYCQVVEVFSSTQGGPSCAVELCYDGTNLIASNGDGNYTWFEEVTTSSSSNIFSEAECVACATANPSYVFGIYTGCDQSICSTTISSWAQYATGPINTPPPNFPIQVTDGNGSEIIYSILTDVPSCSNSCVPPTVLIDDLYDCSPNQVDLSTAINNSSNSGNPTYYNSFADANSAVNGISNMVGLSGVYYVRYEDLLDASCFAVSPINVFVGELYNLTENILVCENETVTYPDGFSAIVSTPTSHISILVSSMGCDSVITTNVSLNQGVYLSENISLCLGSDYTYPDGLITTNILVNETHVSSLVSSTGCDSIIETSLFVNSAIYTDVFVDLCAGSDYTYPDGSISTSITVSENQISNLVSQNACDSIVSVYVNVINEIIIDEYYTVCSGSSYTYPDGSISSNIYTDESNVSSFVSVNGCDSTINTFITVVQGFLVNEDIVLCYGSDYIYPDGTISTNIQYDETYQSLLVSSGGCDSIITTSIQVSPGYSINETIDVCEGTNVVYPDGFSEFVFANTVYSSFLQSINGCDSVITTSVNVGVSYQNSENIVACENTVITYPDGTSELVTVSSAHTSIFSTVIGCDSIVVTNVTLSQVIYDSISVYICYGGDYTYPDGSSSFGIISDESNVSVLNSVSGCDSVVTTNLTVISNSTSSENIMVCENTSYTFPDGNTQIIQGPINYTSNLVSSMGCDSVIITYVSVGSTYYESVSIEICEGEDYLFPDDSVVGNILTDFSYVSSFNTVNGCDSIIETFIFIIERYSDTEYVEVCVGDLYTFPDGTATIIANDFSYVSEFTGVYGCDSSITTVLTGIEAPSSDFYYTPESPNNSMPIIDLYNNSIGGIAYEWNITTSSGDNFFEDNYNAIFDIPNDFSGFITVCLQVFDQFACSSETCQTITVAEEIYVYIPNAFTPEGDGVNESFYPVITGTDPQEYVFSIFNRWGELIFESDVYGEVWDGTENGSIAQIDTYVYRLTFQEESSIKNYEYTGHVNLIR